MEKLVSARTAILLLIVSFFIVSCASSDVSRDVASNVDVGVQNAKNLASSAEEGSFGDTYQNTSQAVKGAVIGGAVGGVVGATTLVATSSTSIGLVPGVAIGAILGAAYGTYLETNMTLADRLENRGVNVVVLGDQILIVIPSSRIFQALSPTIKPSAYSTLDLVAQYINNYTKMLVKISAYTNFSGSNAADLSLSCEQANAIQHYFTADGLNARLIYAEGYGGTRLVQKNNQVWYGNDNYRIEITLEKQYV